MRNLITLLFLVFCFFCSFAQSEIYVRKSKSTDGTKLEWTLILNDDGTFLYNFYRDIVGELNPEENFYGKGTWKAEKNLIFFYTNKETDLDEKYTMDFTNSKARHIAKSPRDKSDKVVKTTLRFYESDIFHIKGLELFKE
jgi:hypothetical protein